MIHTNTDYLLKLHNFRKEPRFTSLQDRLQADRIAVSDVQKAQNDIVVIEILEYNG